jgi:hypothetical protein
MFAASIRPQTVASALVMEVGAIVPYLQLQLPWNNFCIFFTGFLSN